MSKQLESELLLHDNIGLTIRQLTRDDLCSDKEWLTYWNNGKDCFDDFFTSDFAKAYGGFLNQKLIYITWVLYNHIDFAGNLNEAFGCAMIWNTHCLSAYRGRGIHTYVKSWCLNEMFRNSVNKCYEAILSYNRPALRTQIKLNFSIERVYYNIYVGSKKYFKSYDKLI